MNHYRSGQRVEHAVVRDLRRNGYEVTRAAGSKGVDVVAVKEGQVLFVSVKRSTYPPPAERALLWRLAEKLPGTAVPLVASRPLRRPLEYRRLTGVGPREWEPWSPDEIGDSR